MKVIVAMEVIASVRYPTYLGTSKRETSFHLVRLGRPLQRQLTALDLDHAASGSFLDQVLVFRGDVLRRGCFRRRRLGHGGIGRSQRRRDAASSIMGVKDHEHMRARANADARRLPERLMTTTFPFASLCVLGNT